MSASRTTTAQHVSRDDEGHIGKQAPSTASVIAARAAAAVFCMVAAFHAAVVLGAPWGEFTQGGSMTGSLSTSGRVVAALSCALSVLMAGAILARVARGPLQRWRPGLRHGLAWATTLYAVVGVVLNVITRSTAERAVWAPVSVLLLGLVIVVMGTTSPRLSRRR